MNETISRKCAKCGKILKDVEPHECISQTFAAASDSSKRKKRGGTGRAKET